MTDFNHTTGRARQSLSPAWVTNKRNQLASMSEMYEWLPTPFFATLWNVIPEPEAWYARSGAFACRDVPADAAAATTATIQASPPEAWLTGSSARTSAHKGHIYWDGAAWQDGVAP